MSTVWHPGIGCRVVSPYSQRYAGRPYVFTRKGSDPCLEKSAIVFGRLPDMRVCQYEDGHIIIFSLDKTQEFSEQFFEGLIP